MFDINFIISTVLTFLVKNIKRVKTYYYYFYINIIVFVTIINYSLLADKKIRSEKLVIGHGCYYFPYYLFLLLLLLLTLMLLLFNYCF